MFDKTATANRNSHLRSTPTLAWLTTAAMLALGGCADGLEERAEDSSVELRRAVSLGYAMTDDSVLDALDEAYVQAEPLTIDEGLAVAVEELEDAAILAVDMAGADPTTAEDWTTLVQVAMDSGIPVLIEHADDTELMAKAVGLGLTGDLFYITQDGGRTTIQVFDDGDVTMVEGSSGSVSSTETPLDPVLAAEAVGERILELPEPGETVIAPRAAVDDDQRKIFYVDFSTASYVLSDEQTSTLNLDLEIEVVADQVRGAKFAFIREAGSGFHPGNLQDDSKYKRGYYTDKFNVTLEPHGGSGIGLYTHQPETSTSSVTYTSSTGWEAGVNGSDLMTMSYNSSSQESTTINDFKTVNNSSGDDTDWTWQMSTSWGSMYKQPTFSRCKVKSLPDKATSNMFPNFEAVYRLNDSSGTGSFTFGTDLLVRRLTAGGNVTKCKKTTYWYNLTRSRTVTVDFDSVSL